MKTARLIKHTCIIPIKNELKNLANLTEYLELFTEVIFVDGNSIDGTFEYIEEKFPHCKLIKQGTTKGKGSALIKGLDVSSGDFITILDADAPVSILEVKNFLNFINSNSNFDLVKTSRHLSNGGSTDLTRFRKFGAKGLAFIARVIYKVDWTEVCYGFWAIKGEFYNNLFLSDLKKNFNSIPASNKIPYGLSFEFDQIIFIRSLIKGGSIIEIPSFEIARIHGNSSLNAIRDGLRTLKVLLKENKQ